MNKTLRDEKGASPKSESIWKSPPTEVCVPELAGALANIDAEVESVRTSVIKLEELSARLFGFLGETDKVPGEEQTNDYLGRLYTCVSRLHTLNNRLSNLCVAAEKVI